jgi:hypothetical protein
MRRILLVLPVLVSACTGSLIEMATNPNTQTVAVNGYMVRVFPRGNNRYDALPNVWGVGFDMLSIQSALKEAIESVSGCPVVESARPPDSLMMQARVSWP